jgi:hypothetical protein
MSRILILFFLCMVSSLTAWGQGVDIINPLKILLGTGQCEMYQGSGTPTTPGHATCAFYLDSATGDVWTKLSSGSWQKLGTGSVTSVGLALPVEFTVTGSPVTTAGTLTGAWANVLTNRVLASPNGSTGVPSFRALLNADLPTVDVSHGGTGVSTLVSMGVVYGNGTSAVGVTAAGGTNTVLTANGGAPSFSSTPTVTSLTGTTSVITPTITTASGNLTLNPTANIVASKDVQFSANAGTSTYSSETTGWRITNAGSADFRYLYTNEMRVRLFTADEQSVLAGSERVTKSFSTLSQAFTCPAAGATSTLWVNDAQTFGDAAVFVANDWVSIQSMSRVVLGPFSLTDCVGQVTAYADGSGGNAGTQSWTFTRGSGGNAGAMTAATVVPIDQLVIDYGVSGNGIIVTTAVDGAAGVNAPYIDAQTWATAPVAANFSTRCRVGNLLGITSVAEYGLFCGDTAMSNNTFVRLSSVNAEIRGIPLKMYEGATETVRISPSPVYMAMGNPIPTDYATNEGIWFGKTGSNYNFRVGIPGGAGVFWDGTTNTLNVSGSITVTGGNAETTTGAQTKANTAESNATAVANTKETPTGAQTKANTAETNATAVANTKASKNLSDTTVGWAASTSAGGPAGTVKGAAAAPLSGSGLYLGSDYLGYYNGSLWKTYMSSGGGFYLSGTGSNSLSWDGSTLTIVGTVTATAGDIGGFSIVSGNLSATNASMNFSGLIAVHSGTGAGSFTAMSAYGNCGDGTVRIYVWGPSGCSPNFAVRSDGSVSATSVGASAIGATRFTTPMASAGTSYGYSFTGDSDTYYSSDAENRLVIAAGGDRLFWAASPGLFPEQDGIRDLGWNGIFRWQHMFYMGDLYDQSDGRTKKNVTTTAFGTDFLLKLKPIDYQWLEERFDQKVQQGFIAQDVAAVAWNYAGIGRDDRGVANALDYGTFVVPLTKGFQELEARVRALEAKIQLLELAIKK